MRVDGLGLADLSTPSSKDGKAFSVAYLSTWTRNTRSGRHLIRWRCYCNSSAVANTQRP